jgi:trk system potassium uptake protein TrkH
MSHPLLAVVALVGRMVVLFALLMLLPLAFALFEHGSAERAFVTATLATFGTGLAVSVATRRFRRELQPRDGFLLVGLTWTVLPAFGALPLMLALPGLSITDAYFEAMSGFSASGATVLTGLDAMPLSVNVWRCLLNYVGGLGIVVLAVAILPMLGVGGTQLFKAETPGPMKDQKLTPRIAETARGLWTVYAVLSLACFLAYRAGGMSWADALMHMFSTVSLGGLSSHDASFGYWNSAALETIAMVFMLLAGVSFALYFVSWRSRSLAVMWRDGELRAYLLVIAVAIALISMFLKVHGQFASYEQALRHTAFHVISIATTGGYAIADYAQWPPFAPVLMILLGCFATCAGSTGGGIKMVRVMLLLKQSQRELVRIVHPSVVNPVVMGGAVVPPRVLQSVLAFMMIYGASIVGMTMLLLFSGLDVVSAFTAAVACLNNIGPGLGEVGPAVNYGSLSDFQTWVCTFGMLLGRIELLPILVLFTPQFWRS